MNNDITYTKAVGILLMVLCHSLFWDIPVVYMFHMPLFFFFSGYCLKEKYLDEPHQFIFRKIKGIWLPYVKYSVLFLLLHNVMYSLNIYNSNYGFKGQTSSFYTQGDVLNHLSEILIRMQGQEQLLGGYWFLRALFLGSLIAFFMIFAMAMISKILKLSYSCCILCGGAILIIGCLMLNYFSRTISVLAIDVTCLMSAAFFWIGHAFAVLKMQKFSKMKLLLSMFLLIIGSFLWPLKMGLVHYQTWKIIPYMITAVLVTWCIYSLPWNRLDKRMTDFLRFVGMRTLPILTWHFLSFKLVSLLIIMIYGLPIERLAEFPVMQEYTCQGWFILYIVVGILVPLYISKIQIKWKRF